MKSYSRTAIRCVAGLAIAACIVQTAHGQRRFFRGRQQAVQQHQTAAPAPQREATSPAKFETKLPGPVSAKSKRPIQAQYRLPVSAAPRVAPPAPQADTAPTPAPAPVPTNWETVNPERPAPRPMPVRVAPPRPAAPMAPASVSRPAPQPPIRYGRSTINFDNQSGQPALVRLMGPTRAEVLVSDGGQNTIQRVAAGHYVIRVRYGTEGNYRHTEGDHFDVQGSGTSYSRVTITLHGVVAGNYSMHGSSAAAFAAAAP